MEVEYNYYDDWCESMQRSIEEMNEQIKQMTPEERAIARMQYVKRYNEVMDRKEQYKFHVDHVVYMEYYREFQECAELAREIAEQLILNVKITFAEVNKFEGVIQLIGETICLRKTDCKLHAKFERLLQSAKEVTIEGRGDRVVIRLYYQAGEVIVTSQKDERIQYSS